MKTFPDRSLGGPTPLPTVFRLLIADLQGEVVGFVSSPDSQVSRRCFSKRSRTTGCQVPWANDIRGPS